MPGIVSWACAALALCLAGCQLHPLADPSPLQVRNQHPAQLTALSLRPRAARPTPPGHGRADLLVAWSNVWVHPGRGVDSIALDGELWRIVPRLQVGLGVGLDLELELPLLHASGGILDPLVENWHDLFGLPDNGRTDQPRSDFSVLAERPAPGGGTQRAYRLDAQGLRMGDIPIVLSWFPFERLAAHGLGLGLRGGIELPTGSEHAGIGNGGLDVALGLVAGWEGEGVALFGWGNHAWIAQADTAHDARLTYPDIASAGCGLAVGCTSRLSLLAQVEWEQSLLRRLRQENASKDQVMAWLGARAQLSERVSLDFAVGEDLARDVSPDVIFHFGLGVRW